MTSPEMKQIAEKMFPKTLDAIYWFQKKYGDENLYTLKLVPVIGKGINVIVFLKDPTAEVEPVIVTQKKKATKAVKAPLKKKAKGKKK